MSKDKKYEIIGEVNNKGVWSRITRIIRAPNEKVAKVRATEYMHKIKDTKQIG